MYKVKKAVCILLSIIMLFSFSVVSFAAGEPAEGESASEENIPELKSLDTSAIDGKMYAYKGIESYFVIYPEPLEAESRFDVRNAKIECSEEGIVEVKPEKIEEYRHETEKEKEKLKQQSKPHSEAPQQLSNEGGEHEI